MCGGETYGNFHPFLGHQLHAPHDVLLHLDELRQLLGEVGPKRPGRIASQCMS